MSEYKEWRWFE